MKGEIELPPELPEWSAAVAEAVREEAARLGQLEAAAKEHIPLPEGWSWDGQLLISVVDHTWLVRSTLLPRNPTMG